MHGHRWCLSILYETGKLVKCVIMFNGKGERAAGSREDPFSLAALVPGQTPVFACPIECLLSFSYCLLPLLLLLLLSLVSFVVFHLRQRLILRGSSLGPGGVRGPARHGAAQRERTKPRGPHAENRAISFTLQQDANSRIV